MVTPKSHCIHGHAYTSKNTIWYSGHYRCRTCYTLFSITYTKSRYRRDEAFREARKAYQREYYHRHVKVHPRRIPCETEKSQTTSVQGPSQSATNSEQC